MEANLRILQSIKKINEAIAKTQEKQVETKEKQEEFNEFQQETNKKLQDIINEQEKAVEKQAEDKKELEEKIKKAYQDKPKDGKDGKNGKDGLNGKDGVDGKDGKDGVDGKPGKDGVDGKDGLDGTDGVGIYSAEVNDKGELILILTNGKKINCGVVRGKNGVSYNGVSVTNAQIVNGELIITLSTGKTINAGSVVAEPGEITEKDPIFSNSPAGSITNENIESWNNKIEDSEYVHTDNNFTNELKNQITTDQKRIDNNTEKISKLDKDKANRTELEELNNKKYDKTGGTISGDVSVEGVFDLKIEDEDYDSGIKFDRELNANYGTILTLTGYANSTEATNYKPIIRNVNTPVNNYDVANKKYVDEHIVIPNYYLVFLKDDGTVDLDTSSLKYENVKSNLTDPLKEDILDVVWGNTRFYMPCVEIVDVNDGDIKFINDIEFDGIQRHMVLTLKPDNTLITTSITTNEITSNKVQDIINNSTRQDLYPSVWAVFNQFQRKPDIIYSDPTGFEATNDGVDGTWYLTGLDLSKYKRLKFYVSANGTTNDNYTPSHIVEMHLDDRAKKYKDAYTAGHASQNPNNRNRIHFVSFAVSGDKTAIQFIHAMSLYGTAGGDSSGGRTCYLIEGYYD